MLDPLPASANSHSCVFYSGAPTRLQDYELSLLFLFLRYVPFSIVRMAFFVRVAFDWKPLGFTDMLRRLLFW